MRKPVLCLLVIAIAVNLPLAACCPLSLPATAPTEERPPIPSLAATSAATPAPAVLPGPVARGATNSQGFAEITLEGGSLLFRVVDRKTPSTPLSGIELQVCEREGAFSVYAEDPQGNYFPVFLPPSASVPESGIIDMLAVEEGIDYAAIDPQVATEDPASYPKLASSLTQDELAQFFEELTAGSAVILFFVSDTSAPDPDGPLHFTLHQGPFDHVYYAMISDQPEETSTGWVPVAYAAEREKPAFFPFLISAGVGLVLMKVGIGGALAFAVNMILTTLEGAQAGVGPRPIVVPDLAGMTEDEVLGAIVGGPVKVVVRETGWCGEAVIGTVVAQHPFPDSEVYSWRDEPVDVIIYVYNGERGICGPVTVPDVVTGGLTVAEASQAIRDAGLIAVVEEAWQSDVPEGQVILQYPEAGTEVQLGSTVTIRPSAGPGTPTPTRTPMATPTPSPTSTPTPTSQARVLPEGIYYTYEGTVTSRGIPVPWDPEWHEYYDRNYGSTINCRETRGTGEYQIEVLCQETYWGNHFPWDEQRSWTDTWDVSTGRRIGSTGELWGIRSDTGTATITFMGREVETTVWKASKRESWIDEDAYEWSTQQSYSGFHHHYTHLALKHGGHIDDYIVYEGRDVHTSTRDLAWVLTDTNLDLWSQ